MDNFDRTKNDETLLIPNDTAMKPNSNSESGNFPTMNVLNDVSLMTESRKRSLPSDFPVVQKNLLSFSTIEESLKQQHSLDSSSTSSLYDSIIVYTNDQEFEEFVRDCFKMHEMLKKRFDNSSEMTTEERDLFRLHDQKINKFRNRFADYEKVLNDMDLLNRKPEQYAKENERLKVAEKSSKVTIAELKNENETLLSRIRSLEQGMNDNINSEKDNTNSLKSEVQDYKVRLQGTQQHLDNLELAFGDIHRKYERAKFVIFEFEENQKRFNEAVQENQDMLAKQNNRYEALRAHAIQQVEFFNRDISNKTRNFEAEISKLTTQIKRLTIQNKSLNEALIQKRTELEEMNKVYDDMLQVKPSIA